MAMKRRIGLIVTVLLIGTTVGFDSPFLPVARAVEPGCPSGTAPSPAVILCDDFEDGTFLSTWIVGSNSGALPLQQFVLCGEGLGFNDRCASWSNRLIFDGFWGFWGYDALRLFPPQPEFYVRWYQYVSDGYTWGTLEDKSVMLHDPADFVSITAYVATSRNHLPSEPNSGPGMPFVANYQDLDWAETGGQFTKVNRFQNQGRNITLQPGNWYLFEWYVKLNTPGISNGETKLWIDEASGPIAAQTLRLQYTDMRWLRTEDAGKQFGFLRLTVYHQRCDGIPNTCPPNGPVVLNQSHRWDHIVMSTGPIGPIAPPPVCEEAEAVPNVLWPPNHRMVPVGIRGVTHPNHEPVAIAISGVTQDEPVQGFSDRTAPDAMIEGDTVLLRAERSGADNGRSYRIHFTARDRHGAQCTGVVSVEVPHNGRGDPSIIDDGQSYDSTIGQPLTPVLGSP